MNSFIRLKRRGCLGPWFAEAADDEATKEPLLLLMPLPLSCLLAAGRMTCACRRGDPDDLMLVAWNASKTTRDRDRDHASRTSPSVHKRSTTTDDGERKTDATFRETDADACSSTVAATAEPARIRTGQPLHRTARRACTLYVLCTASINRGRAPWQLGVPGGVGVGCGLWSGVTHASFRRRRVSAQISRSRCRAVALVFCFS